MLGGMQLQGLPGFLALDPGLVGGKPTPFRFFATHSFQ